MAPLTHGRGVREGVQTPEILAPLLSRIKLAFPWHTGPRCAHTLNNELHCRHRRLRCQVIIASAEIYGTTSGGVCISHVHMPLYTQLRVPTPLAHLSLSHNADTNRHPDAPTTAISSSHRMAQMLAAEAAAACACARVRSTFARTYTVSLCSRHDARHARLQLENFDGRKRHLHVAPGQC